MYKRLMILTGLIFMVMAGTAWLGHYAIRLHAEGLEGRRVGQFVAVGETIRRDVMRRLDDFIRSEQKRPYTDYQYYYIPEDSMAQQVASLVRSPLADNLGNGLAWGYFQIDAESQIITPYMPANETIDGTQSEKIQAFTRTIRNTLLPALNETVQVDSNKQAVSQQEVFENVSSILRSNAMRHANLDGNQAKKVAAGKDMETENTTRREKFQINIFKEPPGPSQVYTQQRSSVVSNEVLNRAQRNGGHARPTHRPDEPALTANAPAAPASVADNKEGHTLVQSMLINRARQGQPMDEATRLYFDSDPKPAAGPGQIIAMLEGIIDRQLELFEYRWPTLDDMNQWNADYLNPVLVAPEAPVVQMVAEPAGGWAGRTLNAAQMSIPGQRQRAMRDGEMVQIRVEPFVPLIVAVEDEPGSLFPGQVYLLRHVQVDRDHYLQGFRLNENRLLQMAQQAAEQYTGYGSMPMTYIISPSETNTAAADYTAILDFGFGDLALSLKEKEPGWIGRQVGRLNSWYFAVMAVMSLVVGLGLTSVWRNAHAQMMLARKKDDFISAVSHELRTPLTSLRMYAEMLEKNWVATDQKRHEYYSSMRQESERLSRLIENVLDFSRIQRQNKKYNFKLGNINSCVKNTLETMQAYVAQGGFAVQTSFGDMPAVAFDQDSVTQIVINLVDNAVKYARGAADRTIQVRTSLQNGYVLLEVEDHGPGVPHHQRKKIFDEFYRCEDESTRQTTGTGLGLALVQRYAQAHNGFVELLTAKPHGALFRVALACESH